MLVELFTSQGCSSCPPADETLTKLSHRPDVIALAYHVDYWDYIGWKDPFAKPAFTARQREYRKAFGISSVYTPQMVFNGAVELPGQTEAQALQAMERARASANIGPALNVNLHGDQTVEIEIGAADIAPRASVFAAVYGKPQSTRVARGENAGRTLGNTQTVKFLDIVSGYMGAAVRLTWRPDLTGAAGVAVWVQPTDLGNVIAAAHLPLGNAFDLGNTLL